MACAEDLFLRPHPNSATDKLGTRKNPAVMLRTPESDEKVGVVYSRDCLALPILVQLRAASEAFPLLKPISSGGLIKLFVVEIPSDAKTSDVQHSTWKNHVAAGFGIDEGRIFGITTPMKDGLLLIQNQEEFQRWVACSPPFTAFFNETQECPDSNSPIKKETVWIERSYFELILSPFGTLVDPRRSASSDSVKSKSTPDLFSFGTGGSSHTSKLMFGSSSAPSPAPFREWKTRRPASPVKKTDASSSPVTESSSPIASSSTLVNAT